MVLASDMLAAARKNISTEYLALQPAHIRCKGCIGPPGAVPVRRMFDPALCPFTPCQQDSNLLFSTVQKRVKQ